MTGWEWRLAVGPVQANCWILRCPRTGELVVIDPGAEPARILERVRAATAREGGAARVRFLLLTHGHFDHIGGARELRQALSAEGALPIAIHRDDRPLYEGLRAQGELFGIPCGDPAPIDLELADGQVLEVGALHLEVIHTPGHSRGGVCFRLAPDVALGIPETVYTGDTLFKEGIGRTDLMGGDHRALLTSIRTRLLTLDDAARVCPGHGLASSIGHERRRNPFLH